MTDERISKEEACQLLSVTPRTLERKTKSEGLSVTHRQHGRVRVAEYSRAEILALKHRLEAPTPRDMALSPVVAQSPVVGPVLDLLRQFVTAQRLPLDHKLGLNLREAALLTGLPLTLLRAEIRARRLRARKRGRALHIKRSDLDLWFERL